MMLEKLMRVWGGGDLDSQAGVLGVPEDERLCETGTRGLQACWLRQSTPSQVLQHNRFCASYGFLASALVFSLPAWRSSSASRMASAISRMGRRLCRLSRCMVR